VAFIVDPTVFRAEGAVVPWSAVAVRLGLQAAGVANIPSNVQIRWMLSAAVGLPTEPFAVWARVHKGQPQWQPLTFSQRGGFLGLSNLIGWTQGSASSVQADVQAPSGGTIVAFSAAPVIQNFCAVASVAAGNTTVELSAHIIDGLLVSPGISVMGLRGVISGGYANAAGWSPLELVGLPVTAAWAGIGKHTEPQGLVGAVTDPQSAAVDRLKRGAPPFGWGPTIAAGVPAPPWSAPGFTALVNEMNSQLLDSLRAIVKDFAPNVQAAQTITVSLPPPANSSGQQMGGGGSHTTISPLVMTFMAGSTDPFLSLALGFGTAYPPYTEDPFDFMVTARWENGLDGNSAAVDYAAIIPAPNPAGAPPPPANMFGQTVGALRPLATDGNWRETVRVGWDRALVSQLFGTVSFAAARAGVVPARPVVALMATRPSGGFRPIAINSAADPPDPDFSHLSVMDREIEIPSNPSTIQLKYGATVQDLYGQWTPWVSIDQALAQPDLEPARIVSATLSPVAPASGSACPTTLEIEFIWEWRIRTPMRITFVGRLYPAATHGAPPVSLSVPAGFDRALSGGGAPLVVTFSGDVPSATGSSIRPLTESGDQFADSFGTKQGDVARRYRMTLSGITLDFAATPFIGLAIWSQGQERIAPQRVSRWSDNPLVISTGDPRPPVVRVEHVKLASLPDAAGASHARIAWPTQSNAVGYFVYEATEANLLDAFALPQPAPSDTLDKRLQVLKGAFSANPLRRPFTRLNATAFTDASVDVALPRGSTGIHCYAVLGVSAGQVEGVWPGPPPPDDFLIAVAAARIARPAPPTIEAARTLDASTTPATYKARLQVTTRPGPRPRRIDIHRVRVDDAAKQLDTMGPPVARIRASGGGWTVTQTPDPVYGPYVTAVQGIDAPGGTWRRVWYRAVAWTDEDDTRGLLVGRSTASNAAWVVLPPPEPPVLSALQLGGQSTPTVTVQWTCASPVAKTPIGPHQIAVRAAVIGAPASVPPLIFLDTTLHQLGTTQPASGSGVWISGTSSGVTTYSALIRRAAITDVIRFLVQITDPVGRTGEQLLTIPGGMVHPAPDLENLVVQRFPTPPPGRTVLRFTSSSPITSFLDGSYSVKVTALPRVPTPFPPPPTIEMALGQVPTRSPPPPPPPLFIVRSGTGPAFVYDVAANRDVGSFVVRIAAPDGRFVEKTAS
jgi:hypothetical protein